MREHRCPVCDEHMELIASMDDDTAQWNCFDCDHWEPAEDDGEPPSDLHNTEGPWSGGFARNH